MLWRSPFRLYEVRIGVTKMANITGKKQYIVQVEIELSREDIQLLTACCDTHYDSKVRALSCPGPDAWVNGMRNMMGGEWDTAFTGKWVKTPTHEGEVKETEKRFFTGSEINTTLKALESPLFFNDEKKKLHQYALVKLFNKAWEELFAADYEVNKSC